MKIRVVFCYQATDCCIDSFHPRCAMSFRDESGPFTKPFRISQLLKSPDIGRQPADDSTNQNPPPVGKAQRSMRTMMTPCAKALPLFCEYQRRLHEAEEFKRQADIQMSHGYGRAVTIDDPVFENYRRQLLWRVNSPYAKRTLELVSSDPRLAPVAKDGPASPAPPQIDSSVSHQVMDDLAPVQHSDIDHAHDHNEEDYDLYSEFGLVDLLPVAANESGAGSSCVKSRTGDHKAASSSAVQISSDVEIRSHSSTVDKHKAKKSKDTKKSKTSKSVKSPSKKAKKSRDH